MLKRWNVWLTLVTKHNVSVHIYVHPIFVLSFLFFFLFFLDKSFKRSLMNTNRIQQSINSFQNHTSEYRGQQTYTTGWAHAGKVYTLYIEVQ